MKLIILDHFRRWWWGWLIGGLAYGFITMGICAPGGGHKITGVFPLGFFLGAFLLSMDLQRGHTRALLALPVTPKQIGRAWWWVAVGLPVLILGAVTALVIGAMSLIAALSHSKPILVEHGLNYWLTTALMLGTMFFALTGMTSRPVSALGWREQARRILFGILWGGTIGLWFIYKDFNLQTQAGAIIFFITSSLTVFGWFRAETLVAERGGFRIAYQSSSVNTKPSRCAEGRGGLWFLFQTLFNRMTVMGIYMFGFFILIFGVVLHAIIIPTVGHDSAKEVLGGNVSMFTFQFWWVMCFQMFQFAYHLRFLRTLPVSAAKLAGVLVFTPLLAMIVVLYAANLLLAAILQSPPLSPEKIFQMGFFLQISLASALIPLLAWRGLDRLTYSLMVLVLMAGMFCGIVFKSHLSAPVSGIISLLIPLASFVITKLLLEHSSTLYRPRTNLFAGWQMAAGQ